MNTTIEIGAFIHKYKLLELQNIEDINTIIMSYQNCQIKKKIICDEDMNLKNVVTTHIELDEEENMVVLTDEKSVASSS